MENPIKMDDLGEPLFFETPKLVNYSRSPPCPNHRPVGRREHAPATWPEGGVPPVDSSMIAT